MLANSSKGDTIIEVLLAVTVFSVVAVAAMGIMNHGVAVAQQALETTQVKQQIDSQAEALRAAHQAKIQNDPRKTIWEGLPVNTASSTAVNPSVCAPIPTGAFVMNPRTGMKSTFNPQPMDADSPMPYAGIWFANETDTTVKSTNGLWIEAKQYGAVEGIRGYREFRIRACWPVAGSSIPKTIETLVRLHEP